MNWPEKPTCHAGHEAEWRKRDGVLSTSFRHIVSWLQKDPQPYSYPFRTCSYCGSIHPEDLFGFLQQGAELFGADWKYGWPHKFYVERIPNPLAGKTVQIGARSYPGSTKTEAIMGKAPPFTPAKWYNRHLLDQGYSEDALAALLSALGKSGITFAVNENGRISYRAPYAGYQRY
jgi:hypothetical protein